MHCVKGFTYLLAQVLKQWVTSRTVMDKSVSGFLNISYLQYEYNPVYKQQTTLTSALVSSATNVYKTDIKI